MGYHQQALPKGASTSPPEPIEFTQTELGRLENVEVVLPDGVEITELKQTDTVLEGKGRLTDGRRVAQDRICFTVVATTALGMAMLEGLKNGTTNIIPSVEAVARGVLVVRMNFVDLPTRSTDANP